MGREFTDRIIQCHLKIRFLAYPLRRGFSERVFAEPGRDCSWSCMRESSPTTTANWTALTCQRRAGPPGGPHARWCCCPRPRQRPLWLPAARRHHSTLMSKFFLFGSPGVNDWYRWCTYFPDFLSSKAWLPDFSPLGREILPKPDGDFSYPSVSFSKLI